MAVLFADIKGFTSLSESLGPEAMMEFLKQFHDRVTRVVFEHRGTLEKYIGDAGWRRLEHPPRAPTMRSERSAVRGS